MIKSYDEFLNEGLSMPGGCRSINGCVYGNI